MGAVIDSAAELFGLSGAGIRRTGAFSGSHVAHEIGEGRELSAESGSGLGVGDGLRAARAFEPHVWSGSTANGRRPMRMNGGPQRRGRPAGEAAREGEGLMLQRGAVEQTPAPDARDLGVARRRRGESLYHGAERRLPADAAGQGTQADGARSPSQNGEDKSALVRSAHGRRETPTPPRRP